MKLKAKTRSMATDSGKILSLWDLKPCVSLIFVISKLSKILSLWDLKRNANGNFKAFSHCKILSLWDLKPFLPGAVRSKIL